MSPVIIFNLLNLGFSALALWVALRAKPLGGMPYRWGTWVGMETAWMAAVLVFFCVREGLARGSIAVLALAPLSVLALIAAVAAIGILQHRRFGVVAFVCTYLLFAVMGQFVYGASDTYLITVSKISFTLFLISFPEAPAFSLCAP
jgi:hypothetical protein